METLAPGDNLHILLTNAIKAIKLYNGDKEPAFVSIYNLTAFMEELKEE